MTPSKADRRSVKQSAYANERLIKTSHMRHRTKIVSGEVGEVGNFAQPVNELVDNNLSFFSPPPIDNSIFVSVQTPTRVKSRQNNRRTALERTMRTEATIGGPFRPAGAKEQNSTNQNPISVYNNSLHQLLLNNS